MTKFPHARQPCAECPWRRDVPPGKFPPDRFRALAPTAYDQARKVFACHMTKEGKEVACAGFLLRGAEHNLTVRFALSFGQYTRDVFDAGKPLFDSYREMAEANGVPADDPTLDRCRDD